MNYGSPLPVILVAHGSGMIEEDARWRDGLLAFLRQCGAAADFDMAFVKGHPSVGEIVGAYSAGELQIMPLCLSEGAFCHRVIPGAVAQGVEGKGVHIRYLPALAARPEQLLHLLEERVFSMVPEAKRGMTRLLFVSHGAESNSQADALFLSLKNSLTGFKGYSHAYLEQEPALKDVLQALPEEDLLVLPYFLGHGKHTLRDIPALLGIGGGVPVFGAHNAGKRLIYYAEPLGMHPAIADIIGEIVSSAGKGKQALQ